MLFHITHVHSAESCPYHDPETVAKTYDKAMLGFEEAGVAILNKRPSSKPRRGVTTLIVEMLNQNDQVVLSLEKFTVLTATRPDHTP